MKQLVTLLFLGLMTFNGFSQVGINTSTPNAQLDIRASNQATPSHTDGILIPKIDAFPLTSPGSDQHGMMVYLTTPDLGKLPGFYYWNFVFSDWIAFDQPDYDFLETGTSTAPDDINDSMYHSGDVGIGVSNPTVKLDVESSFDPAIIQARNIFPSPASYSTVFKSNISTVNQTNGTISAMDNYVAPNLNTKGYGILNSFAGNTSDFIYGVRNNFNNAGTGLKYGFTNYFDAGTGSSYGLFNSFNQTSTVSLRGVYNAFNNTAGTGNLVGVENFFNGSGDGAVLIGVNSSFSTPSNSNVIGTSTNITNSCTGIGPKYGVYSLIDTAAGGTHYGIYSQATKSTGYAGYFLGRVAMGTSAANNYILPLTRGTTNQIMQTDGFGNVTWQDPSTVISNNAWSTTGNAGLNSAANFIGTLDNQNLVFRRNGLLSGLLSTTNTIFGVNSFNTFATGINNVGLGRLVLQDVTTGYSNIAIGDSSLNSNTTGYENISIGYTNLGLNTSGASNTAVGSRVLVSNTTGGTNTAIGNGAMYDNISGSSNVSIGSVSLANNTTGIRNVAVGVRSAHFNLTGNYNVTVGTDAMRTSTLGNNNTAIGHEAMFNATGISSNVALGYQTLYNNTSGNSNVAIGYQAGFNELGSNKLYIENTNTTTPLVYGEFDNDVLRTNTQRFFVNDPTVNGIQMVIKNSNRYEHSIDANLNFGVGGGDFLMATAENNGETAGIRGDGNNVSIWSPGDGGRQLRILDEDAWVDNNGNPYDNAAEVAYIANNGQYFQVSDQNKKENIQKIDNALNKVSSISGYTYQYKLKPAEIEKGEKPTVSSGVLAQEIQTVLPEAVQKNESGEYFVDYAAITPLLIEAIKEQNTKIQSLEQRLQQLEEKLSK